MVSKIIRFALFFFIIFPKGALACVFFFFIHQREIVLTCVCICIVYQCCGILFVCMILLFLAFLFFFFSFFPFFVLTRNNKFVQRVTVVRQTNFEADFVCCVLCYNRATYACKYVIILVSWHPSACTGLYIRTLRRVQAPDRSRLLPEAPAACWTLCYAVSFYPWSSSASWPKKGQDHKERAQRSKYRLQRQCQVTKVKRHADRLTQPEHSPRITQRERKINKLHK